MTLPFHPLAAMFPLMPEDSPEFAALVADIKMNGLKEPAIVYEDQILDGRNRAKACEQAGVELRTEPLPGDAAPRMFVVSMNLHRRHLTESQRAMAIATLKLKDKGRPKKIGTDTDLSASEAGAVAGVGEQIVRQAKKVRKHGRPELVRAVEEGKIEVGLAHRLATQPVKVQLAAVADPDKAAHAIKKAKREAHEAALASQIKALPDKRYGVIYADPEWRFVPWSEETGNDRAPANHYATSRLDEIKSRDVPSIAADDCVLFLWATAPMLPHALEVMAAWGFQYRSHCVWLKDELGTGYWFRNGHELLLVGVKGEVPAPTPGTQYNSAWDAPAGEPGEKPEEASKMIERYFPSLPRIELNARKARPGWSRWGAESPADDEPPQ